jgi:copper(I)-binding protein
VTRWTRRLLLGAIALLVPVLAGCEAGFDAPTLAFHPASNGTSIVVNGIKIEDAFVLGPAIGSSLPAGGQAGVFLSLSAEYGDRLLSASAPGSATSVTLTNGPVALPAGTVADMSGPAPQIVLNGLTSPLSGGQTVQLVLTFATAGAVPLQVPVEPAAYDYITYSPPPAPTPAATGLHKHKARSRTVPLIPASPSASPTATS